MTIDRPHGYARYKLQGCRCYTCCWAVSEYGRVRAERIAAGTWRQDTAPVRVHLRSLMAAGMGRRRIAAVSGINESTIDRLLYGRVNRGTPPPATTRHDIATRLLAVRLDLHPGAGIEASGTVRRVQALVAIGHTLSSIARELGWTLQNLSRVVYTGSTPYAARVEVRTAQTVSRLYDRLSMARPDGLLADRARRHAAKRGWLPPLAWDDELIDDPCSPPAEPAGVKCVVDECAGPALAEGLCGMHYQRNRRATEAVG